MSEMYVCKYLGLIEKGEGAYFEGSVLARDLPLSLSLLPHSITPPFLCPTPLSRLQLRGNLFTAMVVNL